MKQVHRKSNKLSLWPTIFILAVACTQTFTPPAAQHFEAALTRSLPLGSSEADFVAAFPASQCFDFRIWLTLESTFRKCKAQDNFQLRFSDQLNIMAIQLEAEFLGSGGLARISYLFHSNYETTYDYLRGHLSKPEKVVKDRLSGPLGPSTTTNSITVWRTPQYMMRLQSDLLSDDSISEISFYLPEYASLRTLELRAAVHDRSQSPYDVETYRTLIDTFYEHFQL